MKKILFSVLVVGMIMAMTSCTKNQRVKQFGGTMTYEIPSDKQFVDVTWKNDELWVLTTKRVKASKQTYYFQEKSSFGLMEGTIVIKEK